MNRFIFAALAMALCAAASYNDATERVLFDDAVDSLPSELTVFKDLFGPSFVRAIRTVINDCATLLKDLDASYEPTMDEISKEYSEGMKVYEQEADVHPEQAKELQDIAMRKLKNYMDSTNRAKEEQRKQIKKHCVLRKQDLLRNRMLAVLSVFRDIYKADPDNLLPVVGQLKDFIAKLEVGLKKCRKMAATFDAVALCDYDDAIVEVIEFIRAVLVTLPSQVEKGFPGLPGDTEGEKNGIPLDDGSTPDVFVGDLPNILMPGPVIIDQPPEDDDDIIGSGPVGTIDGSGVEPTTLVATTDIMVTTNSLVTDGTITVATDDLPSTDTTTTDDLPSTDTTTTDDVSPSDPFTTTDVVPPSDPDFIMDTDATDAVVTEQVVSIPVSVQDGPEAQETATKPHNDKDGDDSNDKGLLPLYVALFVCISLLVAVMVIMIIMVLILRHKAMQNRNDLAMSEDDKLSLIKEGYVNPTYKFFDKSSSSH